MGVISFLANWILYYLIAVPVSRAPSWFHHLLESVVYTVVYRIARYRRNVVRTNLRNSFPDWPMDEITQVEKKYYRYLAQMFMESVKGLTLSSKQLQERLTVTNPEVLEKFYDRGQSVLLAGAHYGNWEYMVAGQNLLFRHQAVGIGARISSGFWDQKLNERRQRFGMRVITKHNLHEKLNDWKDDRLAILVLFDQSPAHASRAYWTNFLSQPTGFLFGTEKLAFTYDMPVVYYDMSETKHGYYQIELQTISERPRQEQYGFITKQLISKLEAQIDRAPQYWLWSHKRWKREPPDDPDQLRRQQHEKYRVWQEKIRHGGLEG